jgi:hypothetical protein
MPPAPPGRLKMKAILAAVLAIALTASPAFAARKGGPQYEAYQVSKYGWGWDARGGFYVGPIFKGNRKGYFRCLFPG